MGNNTLERKPSQIKVARLLAELEKRQMTREEIKAFLCISENTSLVYMRLLRQAGKVRVCRWIRGETGGPPKPVFALGPGKNAQKPTPLTRSQIDKKFRRRMKEERPDEYAARLARQHFNRLKRTGKLVRADPLTAWIPRQEERRAG